MIWSFSKVCQRPVFALLTLKDFQQKECQQDAVLRLADILALANHDQEFCWKLFVKNVLMFIALTSGHHKKGIVHGLPTLPLHLNFKSEILLKWVPIGRSDWIHPSGYNVITRNSPVISSKYILSFCVFHYQELHFDRQLIHWGSRMINSLLLVTPYGNIGRGQH